MLCAKAKEQVKKKIRIADMDNDRVDQIIDKHRGEASSLIQVLLDIQVENHWLPQEALERVSEKLQVPLTQIQHIATFYKAFSLVPKGRHEIHICVGTACHVRGATRVLDTVQDLTGIKPGETDLDLKFSLETVNCLGCCATGRDIRRVKKLRVGKNYEADKFSIRIGKIKARHPVEQGS
jgi:NADH-quinone oxidoreductase subunit E